MPQPAISTVISPVDDMFVEGQFDHYMSTGRSALDLILNSMMLAARKSVDSILDLPCGGGRVTRHIRAHFRQADLFVSDVDKRKQDFVAREFGAAALDIAPDFRTRPPRQFDLIFVGSLLTHLDEPTFRRALMWFLAATAPNGICIVTTGGRRTCQAGRRVGDDLEWETCYERYLEDGFSFCPVGPPIKGVPYGSTLCTPSWLMRLCERDLSVRVLGFLEAAWDYNQDALILQRRPIV